MDQENRTDLEMLDEEKNVELTDDMLEGMAEARGTGTGPRTPASLASTPRPTPTTTAPAAPPDRGEN